MSTREDLAHAPAEAAELIAELTARAEAAEQLAADRLAKLLDVIPLEAVVVAEAAEERAPLVGYAVGFPTREDGPLPFLSHTAETRERADRVLGYARRGEPRYAVYAVHGPLADPTPGAEVAP